MVARLWQSLGGINPCLERKPPVKGSTRDFKFNTVSEQFTTKILKNLKTGKASGLENISSRLLKDSADVITKPLTRVLNVSLSQGEETKDWKGAKVTPLFKKGDSADMDNHRPISLLSVASKVLERAVYCQLYQHLSHHELLTPSQCGFRKNPSTPSAAISFKLEVYGLQGPAMEVRQ